MFIHAPSPPPPVIAIKAIWKLRPGGAPGKLRDVPVCVRQMCGQMGHIWMLCVLGHICPSSSCSPMEREMAEGLSKKRDPFPAQEVQVEQNYTRPSVARVPGDK